MPQPVKIDDSTSYSTARYPDSFLVYSPEFLRPHPAIASAILIKYPSASLRPYTHVLHGIHPYMFFFKIQMQHFLGNLFLSAPPQGYPAYCPEAVPSVFKPVSLRLFKASRTE